MADYLNIAGRVRTTANDGVSIEAQEIKDLRKDKFQQDVNQETDEHFAQIDSDLDTPSGGVKARLSTLEAQVAFSGEFQAENTPQGIISESGKIATANAVRGAIDVRTGYFLCETSAATAAKTINATGFVLTIGGSIKIKMLNINSANNATLNINDTGAKPLIYDGERASAANTWEAGETVEVYYDGTNYYANNVAGGANDGVFDVSAKYPTSGEDGGNTYTLQGALTVLNSNLSANRKKGGMSIKFVQSSDNKYVQFRLMSDSFNTTTANWQGVDDIPTAGSNNLVKSSGVAESEQKLFLQEFVGAVYDTWNTNDGQTHYVIPVNGGETVSFDNVANGMFYGLLKTYSMPISGATPDFCNGYTGRQSTNESTNINIPSDCRFFVINNPNGNWTLTSLIINGVDIINGVHGSISNLGRTISNLGRTIGENKKEFLQYNIQAYPCFVARTASHNDIEISVSGATGKTYLSAILRSFISLSLTGFDKTKAHFVSLFRNGYNSGNEYQIEFSTLNNGTVTQIERFYIPVEQITTPEGVNIIDVTSNSHRIRATLDLSIFPNGGATTLRSADYANFIVRKECFFNIDDEFDKVVKDEDLTITSVNLANPLNIDDGHYVTNTGSIASNEDWSLIAVKVTSGAKYTFGGFYLGRNGYYAFYNGSTKIGTGVEYVDPNGRQHPVTVTAPENATLLYIDIKTANSPSDAYSNMMINVGETLLDYMPYKEKVTAINNTPLTGTDDLKIKKIEDDIDSLQDDVLELQSQMAGNIEDLVADLPVSDGTGVSVGYAYIDSTTGVVKVKLQ